MWYRDNEVSKCCQKNGAHVHAQCRVTTNLQIVKNVKSVKHNKMMYACIPISSYGKRQKTEHLKQIIRFKCNVCWSIVTIFPWLL